MVLQELIDRVSMAVNSESIGQEICNRLEIETPKNKAEAIEILKKLNPDLNSEISRRLGSALGTYDHGKSGLELAQKINGAVDVLQAFSSDRPIDKYRDAMGNDLMSKIALEALILALNGINIAKEFEKKYDGMVDAIGRINLINEHTGSSLDDFLIEEGIEEEVQEKAVKKTQQFIRKRIRLKKA